MLCQLRTSLIWSHTLQYCKCHAFKVFLVEMPLLCHQLQLLQAQGNVHDAEQPRLLDDWHLHVSA